VASTLEAWFDAWARGDTAAAREIFGDDCVFHIVGDGLLAGDHRGVDGIRVLLERRRERSQGTFSYENHDLLQNERHGVALLRLRATVDGVEYVWKQVAVYELAGNRITEIWAFEEPGGPIEPGNES
jgi:ketosteroid isomerase-like protein